jgi:hypothetical protein
MEVPEEDQVVLKDGLIPFPIHGDVPWEKVQSHTAPAPEKLPHTMRESECFIVSTVILLLKLGAPLGLLLALMQQNVDSS